jgi:hypothetical protein
MVGQDFGFRVDSDGASSWTPGNHIADMQQQQSGFDVVVGSDGIVDRPAPGESLLDVISRNREE